MVEKTVSEAQQMLEAQLSELVAYKEELSAQQQMLARKLQGSAGQ